MGNTFFIADTHFGDAGICRYENRPFANADEMDRELIRRWNETVTSEDSIYVLGDFGANGYEKTVLSKLNGKKFLVKGNHDTKTNAEYRAYGFTEVYDHPIILDNFWILSHEAIYVNSYMPIYLVMFTPHRLCVISAANIFASA